MLLPAETKFGQGYIFTGVCHSVNRGGPGQVAPPRQAPPLPGRHPPLQAGTPPPGRHPPSRQAPPLQAGTPPPGRHPPLQAGTPPRDTVNARPVRILLECILVYSIFAVKFIHCTFLCLSYLVTILSEWDKNE